MTKIYIELPEPLAEEVQKEGLLEPAQLERLFRDEVRRRAGARLLEIAQTATDEPALSPEDVQTEIDEARRLRRQQQQQQRDAARP
jgi:hypothetical protein